MSTWTDISIGNFTLFDTQNDYYQWYFHKGDRVREIVKEEDGSWSEVAFVGYRTTVSQMRRRLELNGYDRASLERDFSTSVECWKEEYNSQLAGLEGEDYSEEDRLFYEYRVAWLKHVLMVLTHIKLDDWLARLQQAASWPKGEDFYSQKLTWTETGDPVLSLMVSSVDSHCLWVRDSDFNFPCTHPDFYAFAILSATEDEVLCELDLKWLISAGWTDDFNDLEEQHAGATQPLRHARQSLFEMSELAASAPENPVLLRMCYSGIITVMEAYLADIFIRSVKHPSVKRRFVESYEKFQQNSKNRLSDVFNLLDSLDQTIEKELFSLSFHHIPTIKQLYNHCLLIRYPDELISPVARAIQVRHDIVHRNGRNIKGKQHAISRNQVLELEGHILAFLTFTDSEVLDSIEEQFTDENDINM